MWDEQEVLAAIRAWPAEAGQVLVALPWEAKTPVQLDAIEAVARMFERDVAEVMFEQLDARGMVSAFIGALSARGVPVGEQSGVGPSGAQRRRRDRVDPAVWSRLMLQSSAFRCRVRVDGLTKGSGCLVGPGLVLTAWHVIAVAGPQEEQEPPPNVTVELSDGSVHPASIPPLYESPCADAEWQEQAPAHDLQVDDRHDVALLTLKQAAARHLGYAPWPATPPRAVARMAVALADYPEGRDFGLGQGLTRAIPDMTARYLHTIETAQGSSGGACFTNGGELLGLHQGLRDGKGMLVPLERFAPEISAYVQADVAPRQIWRLDGDSTRLVIGRTQFADGIAEAGNDVTRIRGVWVKRSDVAGPDVGLGYSFDILQELLIRRGPQHLTVRIPLDGAVNDLFEDVRGRLERIGVPAGRPSTAGSEAAQTAPEAAVRALASALAFAVNGEATTQGRVIWFFVDNPSVQLAEQVRLQLESLVAAVLAQPRLRLVIAGLETTQLAGEQFQSAGEGFGPGAPGLVVEYAGTFTGRDVLDVLTAASMELVGRSDLAEMKAIADAALIPLAGNRINGFYPISSVDVVVAGVGAYLEVLRQRSEQAGP